MQLFEMLVAQGKTILMVTHDRDLSSRANRIITLADGQIVAQTTANGRLPTTDPLEHSPSVPTGSSNSQDGHTPEKNSTQSDKRKQDYA